MSRVLVVEDDRKTASSIALYLRHAGFGVAVAHDGARGLEMARAGGFDLLLLDLMLPSVNGLDVCRKLRKESKVPVIMLTAMTAEDDRVRGLDLGADDYITKPFSPRELMARVRAVLRRSPPGGQPAEDVLRSGDLRVNVTRHEVHCAGQPLELTPTEFRLLEALIRAPHRAFTREELAERACGPDFVGLDRTVDAHVMNLRRKIEPDRSTPRLIQTVFGVGYKFGGKVDVP